VDRKLRKQIKSDRFAQEVEHGFSWVGGHTDDIKRYGPIALAVILLAVGIYYYVHYQATAREDALAHAMLIDNGTVGAPNPAPGGLMYPSQAEKDTAAAKAFADLASKYHGTEEGTIAQMYMASYAADKGDMAGAERQYKEVLDSGSKEMASKARLPLADVYVAEGKPAEAEKLLRYAVANPTVTVSKEEATIYLARLIMKDHCDESRKLLEPLRMGRTSVSRAAVTALGETATCINR
jgi:predicted negative regulator of RcsB-dependent stress response